MNGYICCQRRSSDFASVMLHGWYLCFSVRFCKLNAVTYFNTGIITLQMYLRKYSLSPS